MNLPISARLIRTVPALSDNLIYLIEGKNGTICIDPGDVKPVADALASTLIAILNTHHHTDHTDGNQKLKDKYRCPLIAPDDKRISGVDLIASESKPVIIDEFTFQVLSTPGHTCPHLSYYCEALKAVFTGDCLFTCGCGRLMEGTPEEMLASIKKIASLPKDTLVYGGHNYLKKNIDFARFLEPENAGLKERLYAALPWSLAEEMEWNPFLRTTDPKLIQSLGMTGEPEAVIFAKLRSLKDAF